eukprot:m.446405 g.446405  ORF g.446405 m.446405 type:complete len:108 (+) comp19355_c0_seq1:46-369(+)
MGDKRKDFDLESEVAMLEKIGRDVIKELDWDDAMAGTLAQEAERKTMAHFQRDGYKIIVLAELISPGSGTAKNLVQLIDVTHDCVVSASVKNTKGVTCYILAAVIKY